MSNTVVENHSLEDFLLGAPVGVCSHCQRFTYATETWCEMPQPDGKKCPGVFLRVVR